MRTEDDPKALFLRRVVLRSGRAPGATDRFPCGHLRQVRREHLLPGEGFPYGAAGATLLQCVVCSSAEEANAT